MRRLIIPLIGVVAAAALLTWLGGGDDPERLPAPRQPSPPAAPAAQTGNPPAAVARRPRAGAEPATIRLNVPPTLVAGAAEEAATPAPAAADTRGKAGDGGGGPEAAAATGAADEAAGRPGPPPRVHYAEAVPETQGESPYARAGEAAARAPTAPPVADGDGGGEGLSAELLARLEALSSRGEAARAAERDPDRVAAATRILDPAALLGGPPARRLTITQAGVPTVTARAEAGTLILEGVGTVAYDPTSVYDVNIKASGLVRDIYFYEGMIIEKGQPLMDLFAPERILAQYNHLATLGNKDRLSYSFEPGKFLEDSRSNLRWWGMSEEEIALIEEAGTILEDYVITAPRAGYVVERMADRGSLINAGAREMEDWALVGDTVARIADLSRVWVIAEIPLEDAALPLPFGPLEAGRPAEATLAEVAGERRFTGQVDHVFARVPGDSRRLRVRLVLDNPRLELLPGMYASLALVVKGPETVRVPRSALLYGGGHAHVLVRSGEDRYVLRRVITGSRRDGMVAVLAGIEAQTTVVENARMLVDPDRELLWAGAGEGE